MPRLYVTAEGRTEQLFVTGLVVPHLAEFGVYVAKPRLVSHGRKHGVEHRGGVMRYEPLRQDIGRWLKSDRDPDVWFTTMLDLYGLPKDFPKYAEAAGMRDPYARVACLENALAEDLGDSRFIPYLQLHEFEAALLTVPTAFSRQFPQYALESEAIQSLVDLCSQFKSPEEIDDDYETTPSRRIGAAIPEYARAKAVAGPTLAEMIGLDKIRKKCPHFDGWVRKLESLGARQT